MAFKLSGFPTHQTKATIGGVTPFKHEGYHEDPNEHDHPDNWWEADGGSQGTYVYDPMWSTGPPPDFEFNVSMDGMGEIGYGVNIGKHQRDKIIDWGKEKWEGMGTGGKILTGAVAAAPAVGFLASSKLREWGGDKLGELFGEG